MDEAQDSHLGPRAYTDGELHTLSVKVSDLLRKDENWNMTQREATEIARVDLGLPPHIKARS